MSLNPRSRLVALLWALDPLIRLLLLLAPVAGRPRGYVPRRRNLAPYIPRHVRSRTVLPDALTTDAEFLALSQYRTVADILTAHPDAGLSILAPLGGYGGGGDHPDPLNEPPVAAGHFVEFPVSQDRALAGAAA